MLRAEISFLPPELEVLERTFSPDEALLQRLIKAMWDAPTLQTLWGMVARGTLEAYRTPRGLILLETVTWSAGRELRIYGMVGRDILKKAEPIIRDLKAIAAHKACVMIGGEGIPRGWMRAAPALGFKPISTHYMMEL